MSKFVGFLQKRDRETRLAAVEALAGLGLPWPKEIITETKELLRDEYTAIRRAAVKTLARLEAQLSDELFLEIQKRLRDKDSYVRRVAVETFAGLGKSRLEEVTPAIIKMLRDSDYMVRWIAADILFNIRDRLSNENMRDIAEIILGKEYADTAYLLLRNLYESGMSLNGL